MVEYKEAYKYIKKTIPSKCSVCVSNHVINLDVYVVNELDSFPYLKNELQKLESKKEMEKGYFASLLFF